MAIEPPPPESDFSNIDNFGNFLISTPRNLKFETFSTSCHIHWVKLSLAPLPRFLTCFFAGFFLFETTPSIRGEKATQAATCRHFINCQSGNVFFFTAEYAFLLPEINTLQEGLLLFI